ncbi:MAG TPA: reverse transcriptase-like protein [Candidatus Dormibacteraeota bacterium]|nr:reverse transcriptase-like protein [Candidatus Dormibacteraeota bacterium]
MPRKLPPSRPARLFAEPEATPPRSAAYTAEIDGAARGNPGPASYGVVIHAPGGAMVAELKKYIGRGTNNVAEYYALIAALDYAAAHGIRALRIRSDSELLVRQMQGRYKVKSPDLRPLFERARKLSQALPFFSIEHVRREQNSEADALANQALDNTSSNSSSPLLASTFRQQETQDAGSAAASDSRVAKPPIGKALARAGRIRARYSAGVLIPADSLNLPENAEVEITIHPRDRG